MGGKKKTSCFNLLTQTMTRNIVSSVCYACVQRGKKQKSRRKTLNARAAAASSTRESSHHRLYTIHCLLVPGMTSRVSTSTILEQDRPRQNTIRLFAQRFKARLRYAHSLHTVSYWWCGMKQTSYGFNCGVSGCMSPPWDAPTTWRQCRLLTQPQLKPPYFICFKPF